MTMGEIGDLLVGVEAVDLDSWQMADELREIQHEFTRDRDAAPAQGRPEYERLRRRLRAIEHSYIRMGFLATKAIKVCRQLEGSDVRTNTGDRAPGADSAGRTGADRSPLAQPGSTPARPPEAPSHD